MPPPDLLLALLLAIPWVLVLGFLVVVVRYPPELPPRDALANTDAPSVSVIVPARNESLNIATCVASLAASDYPDFEIIVVDDRSDDDTAEIARSLGEGNARRVQVIEGEELPESWLGKPWACWQGAREAKGDLLLFTDADTRHAPGLLARAVAGMREDGADLFTLVGRQLMLTFWERLVQPQIFFTMLFRFPRFAEAARNDQWREAIANGQFMLFTRRVYDGIGGHEAVHDEVVEDVALAQLIKREGLSLRIRMGSDALETRMYRSLAGLVEGWSKNILIGGLQSVPAAVRPVLPTVAFIVGVGLWIAPPLVLAAALLGLTGPTVLTWAAVVCAVSALHWIYFTWVMRGQPLYGLLYPLGAAMGTYIFLRSWSRGRTVEWKGRTYLVPDVAERP